MLSNEVIGLIKAETARKALRLDLVIALVQMESSGNPQAMRYESKYMDYVKVQFFAEKFRISQETEKNLQKFSYGLGQLMGGTARRIGFQGHLTELLKPEINLTWMCDLLSKICHEYIQLEDQIAVYNGGPRAVASKIQNEKKMYFNQEYVDKVVSMMVNSSPNLN